MRFCARLGIPLALGLVISAGQQASASSFKKGPYLQNTNSSTATVMWETSPARAGVVTLRTDPQRTFESPADEMHEVVINDLEPGRRYQYSVSIDGEVVSGEFATAPEPGAPFSFVVFGDSRSNVSSHERVVERVRSEVPGFILGTGDMVNVGSSERDWQEFFDIERELLRENVMYPSLGNHDRQGRGRTADAYRRYFALPENSPDPERYYAFTYGSARFLVLDSNAYSFALTDQTAWIEQQLQAARLDPKIEHIFVSMHHPPFSVSLHGGQKELREAWTPLFEKYQIDAVFSGHDHVYSRAENNGVRYFVSGGGGAPLYPRKSSAKQIDKDAVRYFERVNHYLRVHVFGDFVEVSALRADGSLIETVNWGQMPESKDELIAALIAPARGAGTDSSGPPATASAAQAAVRQPASGGGGGRFGLLGIAGTMIMLAAGAVVVWTLRQ